MNPKKGAFSILTKHFFGRFFDKEPLSPQSDAESGIVQLLGLLAAPGAFFILVLQPLTMRGWGLVSARCFFVLFSMTVLGILTVFKWDMLFPDRRDYLVLLPLPLRLSTVFAAKTAALGLFLGLFLVDVNLFSTMLWPGVDGRQDLLPMLGAHLAAVVGGGLFMALAVAASQGLLLALLGPRGFRSVSVWLQALWMMLLTATGFAIPALAGGVKDFTHGPLSWYPGFWFVGLYEALRPATHDPALLALGQRAQIALLAVTALFLLSNLPGYGRAASRLLEQSDRKPGRLGVGALLRRTLGNRLMGAGARRAVFLFVCRTIVRSPRHRLFLAAYTGFGIAVAALSVFSDREGVLRLPLALSFVLVSGLRAAFNFPAEVRSNLVFRISETESPWDYVAGTRRWLMSCAVAPLFAALAVFEFAWFPWTQALFHLAFGLTLTVLLSDLLLLGFRKVPFTCTYFPGKVNTVGLFALYVFGFTAYSDTMSGLERQILAHPWLAAPFFLLAAAAHQAMRWWDLRKLAEEGAMEFEDQGEPAVRTLDIGQAVRPVRP